MSGDGNGNSQQEILATKKDESTNGADETSETVPSATGGGDDGMGVDWNALVGAFGMFGSAKLLEFDTSDANLGAHGVEFMVTTVSEELTAEDQSARDREAALVRGLMNALGILLGTLVIIACIATSAYLWSYRKRRRQRRRQWEMRQREQ